MAAMFGCSNRRIGASGFSQTQAKLSNFRRIQVPPTAGTTSASGPSSLFSTSFDVGSGACRSRLGTQLLHLVDTAGVGRFGESEQDEEERRDA